MGFCFSGARIERGGGGRRGGACFDFRLESRGGEEGGGLSSMCMCARACIPESKRERERVHAVPDEVGRVFSSVVRPRRENTTSRSLSPSTARPLSTSTHHLHI